MMAYFKCPYCGHDNKHPAEASALLRQSLVVYCDSETGGCDRQMVLDVEIKVLTKTRKIQGEEK